MITQESAKAIIIHLGPSSVGGMRTAIDLLQRSVGSNFQAKYIPTWSATKSNTLCNIWNYCLSLLRILQITRKGEYVFHIHTAKNGSLLRKFGISLICRIRHQPYIVHMHASSFGWFGGSSQALRWIAFQYFSKASGVITLSTFWLKYYQRMFPSLTNLRVIPNPSECILAQPPEISDKSNLRILFSGNFGSRKGVYDLIHAFSKLQCQNQLELHLFGEGELEKVRFTAENSPMKDSIRIHEWIPHEDYIKLIPDFDLLVLPSYAEGLPMSILEAMGCGLPIISTPVGGIPSVIKDGENGYLVTPGDRNALADAIGKICSNFEIRKRMSYNSWMLAKSSYSLGVVQEAWQKEYQAAQLASPRFYS